LLTKLVQKYNFLSDITRKFNQTIGILICKAKDKVVAVKFRLMILKKMPKFRSALPIIEETERELQD